MTTVIEQHHVLAGVIWLHQTPIRSVLGVRCASDPEAIWITLRPGRDYGIIDAEHGQLYVSALVGTLVEVTYLVAEQGPGALPDPHGHRAWTDVSASVQALTNTRANGGQREYRRTVTATGHESLLRER